MTYGVPYSFVPGAKAKADEVNANFIEVLNKIETTNSRIDTTNSKIDETNSQLEETNSEIEELNTKITENQENQNSAISEINKNLDGIWIGKEYIFASLATYPTSSNINYNLSSILPDDDNIYELLLEGDATTGTTSGNYINLIIKTSTVDAGLSIISCRTRTGSTMQSNSSVMIPIGTDRILTVVAVSSYVGKFTLYLKAYRKVR
jgi:TolA-binding protein